MRWTITTTLLATASALALALAAPPAVHAHVTQPAVHTRDSTSPDAIQPSKPCSGQSAVALLWFVDTVHNQC